MNQATVTCPRCKHRIKNHSTDHQRSYGSCSDERRDGSPCSCTRVPIESELDAAVFEVDS